MGAQHSNLYQTHDTGLVEDVAGIDPRVRWDDPLIGEWWIDPSKCYYDRPHPFPPDPTGWTPLNRQGARPTSGAGGMGVGKWIYAVEGAGVRTFYYFGNGSDSPSQHMMQYFTTWDGTPWADPHSTLLPGQLTQVWRLDPRMIVRLVLDNTKPELPRWEWAVWAPSADARSFACTSWDSLAPDRHNLQVFDKHIGPIFRKANEDVPYATPAGRPKSVPFTGTMAGRWTIDLDKSSFLRDGQDGDIRPDARARHARQIIASESDAIADGMERACDDAFVTRWRVADELTVSRTRSAGGTIWTLCALSIDRGMLAVTSWDEVRPADRDIAVYRRQTGVEV